MFQPSPDFTAGCNPATIAAQLGYALVSTLTRLHSRVQHYKAKADALRKEVSTLTRLHSRVQHYNTIQNNLFAEFQPSPDFTAGCNAS